MRFAVFFIAILCLIQYGFTYSCFRSQPSTACAIAETSYACPTNGCNGCCNGCCNSCSNKCGCGGACGGFRDASNVCCACKPKSSPVCSCLNECDCKSMIYFPEVEYPVTIMEMTPNYYGTCWSY